jgi:hypothetical protein
MKTILQAVKNVIRKTEIEQEAQRLQNHSCRLTGGAAPLAQLVERCVISLTFLLRNKKGLNFCSLKQVLKLVKRGKR